MKTNLLWLPLAGFIAASAAVWGQSPEAPGPSDPGAAADQADADFPPRRFEPRRYDAIFRKNPFMQEVVPVQEEAPDDPWAEGLEVKAVTRIGGKFVVHVENTKLSADEDREKRKQAYHRLVEGESGGPLRIQTVKPHRDPSQVEVIVATGTGSGAKTATITYSQKQLSAKHAPQAQPARPGQGVVNRPTTTTRRTVTPRRTPPNTNRATPGKRRVILPPGLPGSTQG